ncbi:MAG TPA: hypothetical protein VFF59_12695 [Anaerolineae bacterium]|nr:hypothetical protein [Anaerolineae bacterium]
MGKSGRAGSDVAAGEASDWAAAARRKRFATSGQLAVSATTPPKISPAVAGPSPPGSKYNTVIGVTTVVEVVLVKCVSAVSTTSNALKVRNLRIVRERRVGISFSLLDQFCASRARTLRARCSRAECARQ